MQIPAATERIARQWDDDIVPRLVDYIRIPAKSPHFDPDWETHGHIERVIRLAEKWARAQSIPGLTVEIVRLPGRTPVLLFEVPGDDDRTVMLYGRTTATRSFRRCPRWVRCRRRACATRAASA